MIPYLIPLQAHIQDIRTLLLLEDNPKNCSQGDEAMSGAFYPPYARYIFQALQSPDDTERA